MSAPGDRRKAARAWHPDWTLEVLQLITDGQRQREAEAEVRRKHDARAELAARMRAWFAGELERLQPAVNQSYDSVLGDRVALPHTGELLSKGILGVEIFARLTKAVEQSDGSLRVEGIVSSETEDEAGEIVRAAAMREAIPDYMRWGNIRELHQLHAIGKTLALHVDDYGVTRIVGKIVDPVAITKIKAGVLQGFSIGGSVLQREAGDSRAISRLRLSEISMVDRPCNPDAKVTLWKLGGVVHEPQPAWHCGEHSHPTQEGAAYCLMKREILQRKGIPVKSKAQKKAARKLHKASQKAAAEILARPIVPDTSDPVRKAQGFSDFQALYHAGRRQLFDQRFTTRR